MKQKIKQTRLAPLAVLAALLAQTAVGELPAAASAQSPPAAAEPLYTQEETDPAFSEVLSRGSLKQGEKSTAGVTGSKIHVNQQIVCVGPNAHNPIQRDIKLHTLGNSQIERPDFPKWSRWYQEDGNVQVFRLFKDETNERNGRPLAARVEAHSILNWQEGQGWHEWSGTYTIAIPGGACIFQIMNNRSIWILHLGMNEKGDISVDHRPSHPSDVGGTRSRVIAENMVGKPFFYSRPRQRAEL